MARKQSRVKGPVSSSYRKDPRTGKVTITRVGSRADLKAVDEMNKRAKRTQAGKLLAAVAAKRRSSRSFDPTKLSIKDKIKHAAKPDVITVPRKRGGTHLRQRPPIGYKGGARVGHKIQYRKIKGPTEAKIDKALAKSKLLSKWKRASSAQRKSFLAGTIAAGPAGGVAAAHIAGKFASHVPTVGKLINRAERVQKPGRIRQIHKLLDKRPSRTKPLPKKWGKKVVPVTREWRPPRTGRRHLDDPGGKKLRKKFQRVQKA